METILIIDDDESFGETLEIFLSDMKCRVLRANSGKAGLDIIEREHPDLVITDYKMPHLNGLEVLKRIKEIDANIQVIMLTAFEDVDSTIKAIQLGAYDYVEKLELERIKAITRRALESKKLSERLVIAISEDSSDYELENSLIGSTKAMKEIYKKIGKISSTRVNVLIQGESGTGKELITKIIHYTGITHHQPFIAVNCTALSESLLESELFGHVKGAFTGAIRDKKGKFELAEDGTIFLDEISEISPNLQVKLLRVLQEREFERVGGELSIPMRARIVSASNKNLAEWVQQGKFREDLYYRLKVFTIEIPPLRERKEDIPKLVVHFLKKINKELHKNVWKVPYEVMELLQTHNWVGNVRELENTLLQAVVLAKGDVLEKEYILLKKDENIKNKDVKSEINNATLSLAAIEKSHIKLVLEKVNWDKQVAAKVLGIAKTTLYNKIETYGLTKKTE
ncbi:MAG: sigma-54 dependent transcriptional regulator [Ignavibacteriaceae bacterium]|nr:sigma-54 dependent transcriptional regulator [Ignavibacteriaceae bacterium]